MDGVLLVDKPSGITSHDAVMRMRRTSRERRIGHTGTLDPRATGLLVLVFGQATRLASILTGSDKTYDAGIQLGVSTDTDDADGTPIRNEALGQRGNEAMQNWGDEAMVRSALEHFRGTFDQMPPQHSAKRIAGEKAYELARRDEVANLKAVTVTVRSLDVTSVSADGLVSLRVMATAGFYVRSLARDLGARLGCGGHLASLRRVASGTFRLEDAVPMGDAERLGEEVAARLISPSNALPDLASVEVTEDGLKRVSHGNSVGPEHLAGRFIPLAGAAKVRILDASGRLVALAHARGGALHPVVVLS